MPGRETSWVVIFRVSKGIQTDNIDVIRCMSDAENNYPKLLFCLEIKYRIGLIRLATSKETLNKKM